MDGNDSFASVAIQTRRAAIDAKRYPVAERGAANRTVRGIPV
jgi:hypothetical protein